MANTAVTDLGSLRASTKAVVTKEDVATVLGIDVRTVSCAVASGELPTLRVGRRILIPRERFLAILTEDQGGMSKSSRRQYGEGSIYEYEARGVRRFRVQWLELSDPDEPHGKARRRSKT